MRSFFGFLNGKKTYLGIFLKALAATGATVMPNSAALFGYLDQVGDLLIGVGVAHKLTKIEPAE